MVEREVSYKGMALYQDLAHSHIGLYVEEELMKYFPRLIQFLKGKEDKKNNNNNNNTASSTSTSTEQPTTNGSASIHNAEEAGTLLLQFDREWKEAVKRIDSDIIVGFSNFRTGSDILKKVCRCSPPQATETVL